MAALIAQIDQMSSTVVSALHKLLSFSLPFVVQTFIELIYVLMVATPSPCNEHEFACNDGSRCLDPRRRCNTYDECSDASDEAGCGILFVIRLISSLIIYIIDCLKSLSCIK